jgi:hypothetical protein
VKKSPLFKSDTFKSEFVKWVIVHGRRGTFKHRALIDKGTELCIMPRWIAEQAGTSWSGKRGDLGLQGRVFDVEYHTANLEIVGSGCRATVGVLVPTEEEDFRPEFIIGSAFLQKTRAAIIYVGDHPVLNFPGKMHVLSRGGGAKFIPHQSTTQKASTSPGRRPVKRAKHAAQRERERGDTPQVAFHGKPITVEEALAELRRRGRRRGRAK